MPKSLPATSSTPAAAQTLKPLLNEDWLSVAIGLWIFLLSLGAFFGADLLGWSVTTAIWTKPVGALGSVSKSYAGANGLVYLLATYVFLLAVMTLGAVLLRLDLKRFVRGFTGVFFLSYAGLVPGKLGLYRRDPR